MRKLARNKIISSYIIYVNIDVKEFVVSKRNSVFRSFEYAGNGVRTAFQNEPNFRVHVIAGGISVVLAILLKFSFIKFAILILTITLVIILELINTAIEKIVDRISPNYSRLAKMAKDVSAAAVLLSAFAAILVGLLLFLPEILPLLSSLIH